MLLLTNLFRPFFLLVIHLNPRNGVSSVIDNMLRSSGRKSIRKLGRPKHCVFENLDHDTLLSHLFEVQIHHQWSIISCLYLDSICLCFSSCSCFFSSVFFFFSSAFLCRSAALNSFSLTYSCRFSSLSSFRRCLASSSSSFSTLSPPSW